LFALEFRRELGIACRLFLFLLRLLLFQLRRHLSITLCLLLLLFAGTIKSLLL